jgi:hypothetical protein
MFVTGYLFSKVNFTSKKIDDDILIEHVYAFRGKTSKRYVVIVEEYQYFVFIVKFCLQERKKYSDRFIQLTGLNECSRVLTTIGHIIKEIYNENHYASFGFIGSNLPDEEKENTKRFRLYSKVVSQLIAPVTFEHRLSLKNSAYLLINRDSNEPDLLNKINAMFDRIYLLSY